MPEQVASLAVGLVLNTGMFFTALGTTLNSASSKLASWGLTTTMLVSAPLIALVKSTGQFAREFDQEMRNVNASLQLPEEQFKRLRERVIELSMTTRSTAVDIARSLLMVSQAGVESEEAWRLVEIATHAAGAAYTTTADTSSFLISAMRSYNFTLDDSTRLMDQAIFATQKGAGSFEQLAHTVALVAPMASVAGISFDELIGTIRTLRVAQLSYGEASVSLQGVIRKILMPTEKMKEVFRAVGYESGTAALAALGFDGVLRLLTRAAGGSADKMGELFGEIRAARAAYILMKDDAALMTESINLLGDAAAYEGTMERTREQQYKSLDSQVKRLKNTMMAFGLSLWEIPMPALVKLVDILRDAALGFMKLDDTTKQFIVIAVAVGAALGPALFILSRLLALGGLVASVALNPLTWALIAVAYAAYRWVTARYHIESLADAVVAFSDIAARALNWISDRLVGFVDLIGDMARWGSQAIGAFAQGIVSGLGLVIQAVNYVVGGIAALLGPGSPPAALPNIVRWGQMAINEFLQGMTMADFSILDELGSAIESYLRSLEWESADALSAALIRARVALARVVVEASRGGEASAEAWADLRREIGDATGEMEAYIRASVTAAQADNELAMAEIARKNATRALDEESYQMESRHKSEMRAVDAKAKAAEEESYRMELRHKEKVLAADKKVRAAEEALATFRELSAEIPERFTRGRARQLEGELKAAQKERDALRERQDAEKQQFETRRRQISDEREALRALQDIEKEQFAARRRYIVEEMDAQVEAAQARRDMAKLEADWLAASIQQKEKILDLYQKEKAAAGDLGLDLSELTPEALDIADAVGDIKAEFDKAKEAAAGLFGIWKAFWAGLTGQELDEQLKGMTAEERQMYKAGKKVNEAWEKFSGVLDKIGKALSPIVDIFRKIFGGEIGGIDWASIFETGGLKGGIETLIDSISTWLEEKWPVINAKLLEWSERFWNWVSDAVIHLDEKLQPLLDKFEAWAEKPETQAMLLRLGWDLGMFLVDAIRLVLENDAALAKILMALTYLFIETGSRLLDILKKVGWAIALGLLAGIAEKLDAKNWIPNLKQNIAQGLQGLVDDIVQFFTRLSDKLDTVLLDLVLRVVAWFVDLYNRLVGKSIIPDIINGIVAWFAKLPQLLWNEIEKMAIMVWNRLIQFKNDVLFRLLPDFVNGVVRKFSELPGKILAAMEQGLISLYNRFSILKDDILRVLGELKDMGITKLKELITNIVEFFRIMYDTVVGGSIVPDFVADVVGEFEKMREGVVGISGGMLGGVTTGLSYPMAAVAAIPGGFAGQIIFQNYWDASISAKDRAEIAAMSEDITYRALDRVYGGK